MTKVTVVQHPALPWNVIIRRESDGKFAMATVPTPGGTTLESCRDWLAAKLIDEGYDAEFIDADSPEGYAMVASAFGLDDAELALDGAYLN